MIRFILETVVANYSHKGKTKQFHQIVSVKTEKIMFTYSVDAIPLTGFWENVTRLPRREFETTHKCALNTGAIKSMATIEDLQGLEAEK